MQESVTSVDSAEVNSMRTDSASVALALPVPKADLWNAELPNLYTLVLSLQKADVCDGMRAIVVLRKVTCQYTSGR